MCCHAWGPLDRQHIPALCSSTSLGYSSMFSSPPHKFTSHKVSKPLTHMWAPPLPSLQHMYSLPKKTHSTFLRQNDTHLPRSQIPSMFSGMESLQSASCDETRAPQNRYKLFESGTTKVFVSCLFADMLWRCQQGDSVRLWLVKSKYYAAEERVRKWHIPNSSIMEALNDVRKSARGCWGMVQPYLQQMNPSGSDLATINPPPVACTQLWVKEVRMQSTYGEHTLESFPMDSGSSGWSAVNIAKHNWIIIS